MFVGPRVGVNALRVRVGADVPLPGGLKGEQVLAHLFLVGGTALPEGPPRPPQGRKPFLVRDGVLHDKRGDPFRVSQRQPKADRPTV